MKLVENVLHRNEDRHITIKPIWRNFTTSILCLNLKSVFRASLTETCIIYVLENDRLLSTQRTRILTKQPLTYASCVEIVMLRAYTNDPIIISGQIHETVQKRKLVLHWLLLHISLVVAFRFSWLYIVLWDIISTRAIFSIYLSSYILLLLIWRSSRYAYNWIRL
jgi:hypothetical protein